MAQDTPDDQFDDLFEPFELDELPPPEDPPPRAARAPRPDTATVEQPAATLRCPSCGSANPAHHHHCEQCGARLTTDPLPVAPPPLGGASPGGRALGVLAGVVLLVALFALVFNVFRGGASPQADVTTSTTTTTQPPTVGEIRPASVEASSQLDKWPATNLIDGDPTTYWNDHSLKGAGATLTFRFSKPVQIQEIEIQNLQDPEKFKRNYRIQGFVVEVDDLSTEIAGRLEDTNAPQRIRIASLETTTLTIRVQSTYPAQAVGDKPPFSELAVQEVRFFGVER